VTIGRSAGGVGESSSSVEGVVRLNCNVDDRKVSLVHAHIRRLSDGWSLEDASSKNGTRVNGEPIGSVKLRHGDVIEMGRTFFLLATKERIPPPREPRRNRKGL